MHKLKIKNCKNHIEEITLNEGIHSIGRTLDSTLRLEGEEVSRIHARLLVNHTECILIDEKSKNGTFLNKQRINSSYLKDGDIIQIGKFDLQFTSDSSRPHTKGFISKKARKKKKINYICLNIGYPYSQQPVLLLQDYL